jgi:(p)ppGpp synthase/HD superfamily hydrolase
MSWNRELFKTTLDFAAKAHGTQTITGSGAPYVVHLMKVAGELLCVADATFDVDFAMQCALLHDCMEDAGVTARKRFEPRGAAATKCSCGISEMRGPPSVVESDQTVPFTREPPHGETYQAPLLQAQGVYAGDL